MKWAMLIIESKEKHNEVKVKNDQWVCLWKASKNTVLKSR